MQDIKGALGLSGYSKGQEGSFPDDDAQRLEAAKKELSDLYSQIKTGMSEGMFSASSSAGDLPSWTFNNVKGETFTVSMEGASGSILTVGNMVYFVAFLTAFSIIFTGRGG